MASSLVAPAVEFCKRTGSDKSVFISVGKRMWIRQTTSNILVTARNYEESTDRLTGGVKGKLSGKGGKTKVLCDNITQHLGCYHTTPWFCLLFRTVCLQRHRSNDLLTLRNLNSRIRAVTNILDVVCRIHIRLLTLMKTLLSKPVRLQNSLLLALLGYLPTIDSGVQFSFLLRILGVRNWFPFNFLTNAILPTQFDAVTAVWKNQKRFFGIPHSSYW